MQTRTRDGERKHTIPLLALLPTCALFCGSNMLSIVGALADVHSARTSALCVNCVCVWYVYVYVYVYDVCVCVCGVDTVYCVRV